MTPASLPLVSVIVPVWNGSATIDSCLRAINAQDYPADRFELLVVDNGSTDDTRERVSRHGKARLLVEPVASSYRARNRALAEAVGEYVLFTDADCVASPGWIRAAVAAARANPLAGVIGGRITLFDDSGDTPATCSAYEALFSFNQERTLAAKHCVTANWLSPRTLLQEQGGFDATLRSGGDTEMSRRIAAAGYSFVYAPDMIVSHPIRGSYDEIRTKYLRTLGGRWAMRRPGIGRYLRTNAGLFKATGTRVRRTLSEPALPLVQRLSVTAMLLRLHGAATAELARLAAGGEPRRS